MCCCLLMTSEFTEDHLVISPVWRNKRCYCMSYTSPLISRRLVLPDVTAEQEIHLSEPALGRTPVVTSTFPFLITLLPRVKLTAWITQPCLGIFLLMNTADCNVLIFSEIFVLGGVHSMLILPFSAVDPLSSSLE